MVQQFACVTDVLNRVQVSAGCNETFLHACLCYKEHTQTNRPITSTKRPSIATAKNLSPSSRNYNGRKMGNPSKEKVGVK
jgi:hypothetical protein